MFVLNISGKLAFTSKPLKRLFHIFSISFIKKNQTFKNRKPILSTFKGLEIELLEFKGFQDLYEPCLKEV